MEQSKFLPSPLIVSVQELTVNTEVVVGLGEDGIIYEGKYNEERVAVKTLKPGADPQRMENFLEELKVMSYIGNHANIVLFLGLEVQGILQRRIHAILELSLHGSLESYLIKYGKKGQEKKVVCMNTPDEGSTCANLIPEPELTVQVLNSFAHQLAEGMAYLAFKNVYHGDLATENVLVFDGNRVKISNFGFARIIQEEATFTKMCRWRWAAPETLENIWESGRYEFSTKADVWSFGITLWEIYTFGDMPYPHKWTENLIQSLRGGLCLEKPQLTPENIYDNIMMKCWSIQAEDRPTFEIIRVSLTIVSSNFMESTEARQ